MHLRRWPYLKSAIPSWHHSIEFGLMVYLLKNLKTKFLKLSAGILGFFSSSSLKLGPPKGYYRSAEEYISEHKSMGKIQCLFKTPKKDLVSLKKGRVCLHPWAFISADDKLLFQESNCYNTKPEDHWVFKTMKLPQAKHLKGKALFLSFRRNYWHSLTDDSSLLNLLEATSIDLESFDHIICERPDNVASQQLQEIWNINQNKLVSLTENKHLECEELSFLAGSLSLAYTPILQTREKILSKIKNIQEKPSKRLIASREDATTRRWLNQSECVELLTGRFNFECILPSERNLFEQAEIFNQAEVVVGIHGAALSNILFMRAKTTVIELRYRGQEGNFSSASCYEELSKLVGINHITVLCNGEERPELRGRSIEDANILVDKTELLKIVESCL